MRTSQIPVWVETPQRGVSTVTDMHLLPCRSMRFARTFLPGLLALLVLLLSAVVAWKMLPRMRDDAASPARSDILAAWTLPLPDGIWLPSLASVPDAGLSSTIFVVQLGDAADSYNILNTFLPSDHRIVTETELRRFCALAFGDGVSCTEEVLPALQGPITLTVGTGDPPFWLLHGDVADSDAFRALLPLLHASTLERISTVSRVTRQISPSHSYDNLRKNPAALREGTEERRGWRIQETTDRQGRGLISAVRGNRFILGAERTSLLNALDILPSPLPSSLSRVIAQGAVRESDIAASWLSPLLPPSALASLPKQGSGMLLWQAEQRGNQLTITVR